MVFVRFIAFAVVRAWQGFWRNAMMSLAATATVILMLVLLSGLFIVISGLNSGLAFIESKVAVTAQLVDDLSSTQVQALIDEVEELPGVKSVLYVSPEMAMERLRETYRERGQELDLGDSNDIKLFASIEIALDNPNFSGSVSEELQRPTHPEKIGRASCRER